MSDLWNNINPSKADHVLGVVGGTLDEIMATSKHRLVVTPMHEKIINAIIEFCRSKHLRPLILVTDSVATSSWERVFRKRLKEGVDERKFFGEPNELGFPLMPLIPYNYFGSCFKITSNQQVESRRLHLREISSISAYEGDELSSGDIDASLEMDKVLRNLERVSFDEYITGLSPLMEGDVQIIEEELGQALDILSEQKFDLVIADGAARLGGAWMTLLREMDEKMPCPFIGFSTFKPEEAFGTKLAHQQRQNFFGTRFTELSLTSLSVDGACRPWRELISFVEPDRQSAKAIEEVIDNLHDLIQDINYGHRTKLTLHQYIKTELGHLAKDMLGNWARRQEWTSSVLYYGREHDLIDGADWEVYMKKVPLDQPQGNLLVYREYIFNVLLESEDEHDHKYAEQFITRVKKVGYLLTQHDIRPYSSLSNNLLGRTSTKEDRLLNLMEKEWEETGDKFRGLIIADFTDSSQDALDAGLPNADSCGLMSVFWKCQENLVTVQMNPVVVWENMLYCNPRFASRMEKSIGHLIDQYGAHLQMTRNDDGVYCYFKIKGEGFTQAFWTWLINSLLSDGTTLCILANREVLLDEWNGLGVNTVFNLTVTNSEILRARLGHRLGDTEDMGLLAAHLWDIVSVMPDVQGGLSPYFIYEDLRKSRWAICDDGKFELGLGAISPDLGGSEHKTMDVFNKVNAQQELLISRRKEVADSWRLMGDGEDRFLALEVYFENDLHLSKNICREVIVKKNEYRFDSGDFNKVLESIYLALAHSLCEMKDKKYEKEMISFEILKRNNLAHRLLVSGELAEEFIEMVEQLFAPFKMQFYLLTMALYYDHREKSLFKKEKAGEVYESAFAIPELFKTKDDLLVINKYWQEFVGRTKVYSMRIPQTKSVIQKLKESKFNLRPQCYRTEVRMKAKKKK
ncbi:DEAD/DEAH box helicase [Lentisphaera araneosa HTCC2155]|uniref:DEAD/DEAH box helicase n=1 Tax=Lentisphaera araneosa HTCC2155 TaxID=313628 RepID=A6DU96_9BACT|nr:hypothetical protein [Lentisphaera araneosa]EDM24784.1 DEAD/DEAH box helicase [Lentisphaera araneosa HTCC2155]